MSDQRKIYLVAEQALATAKDFEAIAATLQSAPEQSLVLMSTSVAGAAQTLEQIAQAHQAAMPEQAMSFLAKLRQQHFELAEVLLGTEHPIFDELNDELVSIEWDLEDGPHENTDYAYDQIISVGELLAIQILTAYLNAQGLEAQMIDARDLIVADDEFRAAKVLTQETQERLERHLLPALTQTKLVITQANIASTTENYSITLGKANKQSHSVAAIAQALGVKEAHLWND